MKKILLSLGQRLTKAEQINIKGGGGPIDRLGGCTTEAYCNSTCDGECVQCLPITTESYGCQEYANQ